MMHYRVPIMSKVFSLSLVMSPEGICSKSALLVSSVLGVEKVGWSARPWLVAMWLL